MSTVDFVPSRARAPLAMRLRRRAFRSIPLLVWLAAIGLVWWLSGARRDEQVFRGIVETRRHVAVAPASGELMALAVGVGDRVEVGQVLGHVGEERAVAPAGGQVESIEVHLGARVAMGQALLTIVDPRPSGIVAFVPVELRSGMAPEMAVEVEYAESPGKLVEMRIVSVSDAVVRVPPRLWGDPRIEEWAVAVRLPAQGGELPGQSVLVRRR